MIGSEAVRSYGQEAWFGPFSMRHTVAVQEAIPASDEYVHARGTWTIDLTPKDGNEPSTLRGTLMWLLRNEGGELKGARAARPRCAPGRWNLEGYWPGPKSTEVRLREDEIRR